MNTNIHEWRILKIKIEIRVHSCSFVAKMERLNTHTEIAISLTKPQTGRLNKSPHTGDVFSNRHNETITAL